MANFERNNSLSLLGVTSSDIRAEREFYNTFITNHNNERLYVAEISNRIRREQPMMPTYFAHRSMNQSAREELEIVRGIVRGYNILPPRQTKLPLSADDIYRALNCIENNTDNTGKIKLDWFYKALHSKNREYADWLLVDEVEGETTERDPFFTRGGVIISLPFFLRDEYSIGRKLIT